MENAFGQPQNVVVLGGSSDIAGAIVQRLVAHRTRTVVLAGRNESLLETAAERARAGGASLTAIVPFDAQDPSNAASTVGRAFDAVGAPVDLVIMAVGMLGNQRADENDPDAAARMSTVNFTWPVAALTEVRRRLVEQGSGRILLISSVAAIRARRATYLYGGAKAGLDRLCQGMADSLIDTGVTLQIVRAGFVRSKMTEGLPDAPFTVGVERVADDTMRGLNTTQRVFYSPPIVKYAFTVLRHLPAPLWHQVVGNR